MEEIWKTIDEFDGNYMISNFGRLKSIERFVKHPKGECLLPERILSEVHNKKGYVEYQITYNGKHYSRKAHRLVAQAFISNPDNKPFVNHKDGVKDNNNVENLEWCTNQENVYHAYHNELVKRCKHILQLDKNGNLLKIWTTTGDIERELGLNKRHIHEACRGIRRTFHGYVWKYQEVC